MTRKLHMLTLRFGLKDYEVESVETFNNHH